jgi:hypothetical protein
LSHRLKPAILESRRQSIVLERAQWERLEAACQRRSQHQAIRRWSGAMSAWVSGDGGACTDAASQVSPPVRPTLVPCDEQGVLRVRRKGWRRDCFPAEVGCDDIEAVETVLCVRHEIIRGLWHRPQTGGILILATNRDISGGGAALCDIPWECSRQTWRCRQRLATLWLT